MTLFKRTRITVLEAAQRYYNMYFDKVAGGSKLHAIPFHVVNKFVYTITCLLY